MASSRFAAVNGPDQQWPLLLQSSLQPDGGDQSMGLPDAQVPDAQIIEAALAELGQQLGCDRVFLYLRSPQTGLGRVPFCWRQHEAVPLVHDPDWKAEPTSLPDEDPLFAAALRGEASIFVDDVEAASPAVLNREFEHRTFGHRALIHAHLWADGQLWGVLQACVFDTPRPWSRGDHQWVEQAVAACTPLARAYVRSHPPSA